MARTIGIDLGTTFSCVAYLEGAQPRIIPNLEGMPTTPSVVTFASTGERVVGNLALRQAVTNPENTIYAIKRLIGRKYRSPEVEEARRRMPFKLCEAVNGDVMVEASGKRISPQEISSMVLRYLKECAEAYFGEKVTDAIVTVPAHFNDAQRQATKDAAKISELNVLRVINEPTAASLAYGLGAAAKKAKIAVYDLGGGTFDVTVLETYDGVFNVLATSGNTYLGGEDFDNRIIDWLVKEFKEENDVDLSGDRFALQRMKEAAERVKRELSFITQYEINLPFIYSGPSGSVHLKKRLTREKLEELTGDIVERTIPYLEEALKDAKLRPAHIAEVILVGGQTRRPLIRKMIADFFRKEPVQNINPDEIVAMGAAIQSGILKGEMKDIVLLDVCPLSLGIEAENETFVRIIDRNTTIPVKKTKTFTTVEHNQRRVRIHVLQGEREIASENKSLGMFDLVGVEAAPAGFPQIDVTFEIDADGTAKVSARDVSTGREQKIEVQASSGLGKEEIKEIILKAQRYAGEDRDKIRSQQVKTEIRSLLSSFESYYDRDDENISSVDKEGIQKLIAQRESILEKDELNELENYKIELTKYFDLVKMLGRSSRIPRGKAESGETGND